MMMMVMMVFMHLSIFTGDYNVHSRPPVDVAVLSFIKTHVYRAHSSLSSLYLSERDADSNLRRQRRKKWTLWMDVEKET